MVCPNLTSVSCNPAQVIISSDSCNLFVWSLNLDSGEADNHIIAKGWFKQCTCLTNSAGQAPWLKPGLEETNTFSQYANITESIMLLHK